VLFACHRTCREWRRQPHRRQRIEFDCSPGIRFSLGLGCGRLHIQHRDMGLMQIGKFAGAGQHRLAAGDVAVARGARCRDLALDQVLLEACEHPASLFDFLKQRPRRFAKLLG
jgi:hypothetical protein